MTNHIADELGLIQAQIADLKAREETIRNYLVGAIGDAPKLELEGDLFRLTFSACTTRKTNWKAVAEKLNPSHQLVSAHTVDVDSFRLNVRARLANAA